jgi:hypothetical protein
LFENSSFDETKRQMLCSAVFVMIELGVFGFVFVAGYEGPMQTTGMLGKQRKEALFDEGVST